MQRMLAIVAVAALACGGEKQQQGDQTVRDLSMAPAESVAALNDQPAQGQQPTAQPAAQPTRATTPQPAAPKPVQPAPKPATPARPATVTRTVGTGTAVELAASDTITSRHNKKGESVVATVTQDVKDPQGRVVIPAGSRVMGTISDIAPAESSTSEGRLILSFRQVEIGGTIYEIAARTDSLPLARQGRGVTAGDAAKVGVGAAAGAIAGRVIGGNKTGTIVGGVVGAAAGTAVAAATKDVDVVLPAGAPIRLVLTAPFSMTVANR